MDVFDVGRKATIVSLYVAIFSSIIALALFGGGLDRELINIDLLIGARPFYDQIRALSEQMPSGETNVLLVLARSLTALGGVLIQFTTVLFGMFILMASSLIKSIPTTMMYLASPLVFILSFLQLTVWMYITKTLIDTIRGFFLFRLY
ncbi:MAG: hypothetical protein QW607_10595 [Desulfurococcaceae archaeon]